MIAFGEHERLIGDSAVAQIRSNFKNTIQYSNRFIGLNSECKEQIEEESRYISSKFSLTDNKKIEFNVINRGEVLNLTSEQIYAAYLKKIKKLFCHEDENVDVVLSVPPYYTSIERQAILDACKIAKINCIRLLNENTAISLAYGFFRRQEFNETPKNIWFVDIGHGKTTCTISSFTNKNVNILSHASNRNLGGRKFDQLIFEVLSNEFNKKYGCDPRKAPKARLRMLDTIEKTRKILSANSESSINVECLLEDNDLHRNITREELEVLIQPHIEDIKRVWEQALKDSKLKESDIDCVELVGEATRMPIMKKVIEETFKKDTSFRTINSSEWVARGCSLMAAMILPQFHVAKFEIHEANSFDIDVSWSVSNNNMKTKTLFTKNSSFPSVKSLTFDGRSEPMDVGISYHSMDGIVDGLPQLLARYRIEPPAPKEEKFSLKLRIQLDQNGIPALDTAEFLEEYIEIKKIPTKAQSSAPAAPSTEDNKEGDKPAPEAEQTYEEKEVKKTRSTEILFKFEHHGFGAQQINEYTNLEDDMCKFDNAVLEVKIMRNHLETYVYDMRAAIDTYGNLKDYIKEGDKAPFLNLLNQTEQWIYDEGENAAKNVYQEKLDYLKKLGEPCKNRYKFHDSFPSKLKDFQDVLANIYQNAVDIPEDSHITKEEREALIKLWEENTNWLGNSLTVQESLPKYEDPAIDLSEFDQRKSILQDLANKTLNKPAPKKEEAKADESKPSEEASSNNKDSEMKDS